MNDSLVFNHHALPFDSTETADAELPDFLRLCVRAQVAGFRVVLLDESCDANWFRLELSPGYFWQDWHNRHGGDGENRDMIRAFRTIATRQPFFSTEDLDRGCDLIEVFLQDSQESLDALLAAVWHESHLISLPTRFPWNRSPVDAVVVSLDASDHLQEIPTRIVNLCSLRVWADLEPEIRERKNAAIRSGKLLLKEWQRLYPALSVCGKAFEQLSRWSHGLKLLDQVKESLAVLNAFSEKWGSRDIPDYFHDALRTLGLNYNVSGESASVSQNPSLRKHREFWLPSGKQAYFENHIKLMGNYRLHFYPDAEARIVFIGYIGPHLPLK